MPMLPPISTAPHHATLTTRGAEPWTTTRSVFDRYNIVDEADLHDGVQKLQEARPASGVRFEYYLKGPLDALFED